MLPLFPPSPFAYAFRSVGKVNISGVASQRLMIVLRTNGCAYDSNKTGCTMCDFAAHAIDPRSMRVRTSHLMRQFEAAVEDLHFGPNEIEQIDLLTLGSFLHDWEIEPRFRREILRHISRIPGIRKVVIESRAEYVSEQKLVALRDELRSDQILELGLGGEHE